MTRVNVIDPQYLCDEHLRAARIEYPRIPNQLMAGKLSYDMRKIPAKYTVRLNDNPAGGKGHMYFFANKLGWLHGMYDKVLKECEARGFKHSSFWKHDLMLFPSEKLGAYEPTPEALELNIMRIHERWPKDARFRGEKMSWDDYRRFIYPVARYINDTRLKIKKG